MKVTKTLLVFILSLLLITAVALPAAADVIIEPDDSFYSLHKKECVYSPRSYILNSEVGHVYLYKNPKSSFTVEGFPNGKQVYVAYLYTNPDDGTVWGHFNDQGWFRMSDLSVIYDSTSFFEEYNEDIVSEPVGTYTYDPNDTREVVFWNYPGGKVVRQGEAGFDLAESSGSFYVDDAGNEWCHIGYYYGHRNIWVCLSDPYSTEVGGYSIEHNQVLLKADPTPEKNIPRVPQDDGNGPKDRTVMLTLIGVGIIAVVAITTILIRVIYAGKKPTDPDSAEKSDKT